MICLLGLGALALAEPTGRTEPMVAMVCEGGEYEYHNKFLSNGKWKTDTDVKATCKKDKVIAD